MIPTVDSCGTYTTKDDKLNVCYATAACPDVDGNQIDRRFTSRTDKPRLAHEVYFQWITMPSPLNIDDNVMCKLTTQRLLLTQKDLLMAAYSGPSIMYRK